MLPNGPSLDDIRDEFQGGYLPSSKSLRDMYTAVIGTCEGASSSGSGGRVSHFSYIGQPSSANTLAATSITESFATLNGQGKYNVKPNSALRQYRFFYAKDGNFIENGEYTGWEDDNSGDRNTTEAVSETLTNLDPSNDYSFRVQFRNGFGVVSGDIEVFTTDALIVCNGPGNLSPIIYTTFSEPHQHGFSWSHPSGESACTYEIQRNINGNGWGPVIGTVTNQTSFMENRVSTEEYTLAYRIRRVCGTNNYSGFIPTGTTTIPAHTPQ